MAEFESQIKHRTKELKNLFSKGIRVVGQSWKKGWYKRSMIRLLAHCSVV
ncbi:unnamed protein product [Spirodela intermedia]|uniref:Uncharacterized protein n=1 Tax=Spirodela intermedia TaxID=51605 RepID=A0A7I8J8R6_SPIIN|nr:unnamed protein product [Spirodela intermedia]CAA6666596.1 unnamed protein product [Spirodela intermedia]